MACVEVCHFGGIWNFSQKLRFKDTEAYQERMRMNYVTFCEILTATLVILPFAISVWTRCWPNCWPKNYHPLSSARSNGKNYHQVSCRIRTCPNYMIVDDSWNYHQQSWPFGRGFKVCLLTCSPFSKFVKRGLNTDILSGNRSTCICRRTAICVFTCCALPGLTFHKQSSRFIVCDMKWCCYLQYLVSSHLTQIVM